MERVLKDYYRILGVPRNASTKEIKQAYRKLVMKYHPDVSGTKDTEEILKVINEAYSVLSNPTLREKYENKFSETLGKNKNESIVTKSINNIVRTISLVVTGVQRILEDIASDKVLEKLSNEELLQRLYFSSNEFMKIAALRVMRQRKKKSIIPYLLGIIDSPSISPNLRLQILQTLRELGYQCTKP